MAVFVPSTTKPEEFARIPNFRIAVADVNKHLAEVMQSDGTPLVDHLWGAVNETIALNDCAVFTYIPDLESDPFSLGSL